MGRAEVIDHVRPYVDAGFAIHWLHPRQKRPYGNDWSKRPVATIEDLAARHRPKSNVGVRLGRYSKIGDYYLHVLDIDIRVPEAADEAFARLRELFPDEDIDALPMVRSGSGGVSRHLYLLVDRPFRSKKLAHSSEKFVGDDNRDHWTWEIELFGTGKQVAMPPSVHPSGGRYEWVRPFDFDELDMGVMPVFPAEALSNNVTEDMRNEALEADDEDSLLDLAHTSPPLGLSDNEARDLVFALPVDEWCEDRDGWLKVGMALHHEFDASAEGFDIWCDFSQQSGKFDADDQERVWKSFDRSRGETFTMASVRKMVQDEGLNFALAQRKLDAASLYRPALREVAQFDLMPSEESVLISRLMQIAGDNGKQITKGDVQKDLARTRKEIEREGRGDDAQVSIESWLAEETLRVFFAKGRHLVSVAGNPWNYVNGLWRMTDKEFIRHRVWKVLDKLMRRANGAPEALADRVVESSRTDQLNALVNSVSNMMLTMQAEDSGSDPLKLAERHDESVMNTPSGELWFTNGTFELEPHDPDNRFTNQLRAEYDEDAACREWDETLLTIFSACKEPEEVIRHLHEVMGYLVQTNRDLAAWVLFHGGGQNGKTFIAGVLQEILGPNAAASMPIDELARNNHATATLVGKLLLIDDDFDKNAILPSGILKKLSESKKLTANPKFGATFDFVSRSTPMILSNHWPRTSDMSYGMERRAMVFDFNYRIPDDMKDEGLGGRIRSRELPGVLNRLIEGWCRVQKRGGFAVPADCLSARNKWMGNRNALASFLHDHVKVTGDLENDRVKATELWGVFDLWCSANNVKNNWGRNTFYLEVESMEGVRSHFVRRSKWVCGLVLEGPEDDFDDGNVRSPVDLLDDDIDDLI